MADRLAGGTLADQLREHLAAGRSYDAIARHLFADFGIEVTRGTVGNWCRELGLLEAAAS